MWMPSADETLKKLKQLYSFIGRYTSICEAHSVDFYLHDNWSNCLPQSWRDEIVSIDECWYVNPPSGGGPMKEGRSSTSEMVNDLCLKACRSRSVIAIPAKLHCPGPKGGRINESLL